MPTQLFQLEIHSFSGPKGNWLVFFECSIHSSMVLLSNMLRCPLPTYLLLDTSVSKSKKHILILKQNSGFPFFITSANANMDEVNRTYLENSIITKSTICCSRYLNIHARTECSQKCLINFLPSKPLIYSRKEWASAQDFYRPNILKLYLTIGQLVRNLSTTNTMGTWVHCNSYSSTESCLIILD